MTPNLKVLIGKLNTTCKKAAEQAIHYCVARSQFEVDLEHLFLALLDDPKSDFSLLAKHFGVNATVLEHDLLREIENLRNGNTRTPVFSAHLSKLFEHAWLIASLDSAQTHIRSAHLLLALLSASDLSQLGIRATSQFDKFAVEELKHKLAELIAQFPEEENSNLHSGSRELLPSNGLPDPASEGNMTATRSRNTPALDKFTNNLTQYAREGKIDPVVGRDEEIRQLIDILMRRRQNNPILTGEAGVGKTAVVEGLAQRIAEKAVPEALKDVELHALDLGLLQAGASVKGEFESRLQKVIDEVSRSPHPIILFIDEAHTIIGAGGQPGQNDAANLLKPALARGELRTIAATTWSEYKKYFEKDAALARRFQVVKVEEPSEAVSCAMLRAMASKMESHFKVRVMEDAISEAVRLSARYIVGRQLPDKAISVLDTACAKVALKQTATPAPIEDARRLHAELSAEIAALEKELSIGCTHGEKLAELRAQRDMNHVKLVEFEARWEKEKLLVQDIQALREILETEPATADDNRNRSKRRDIQSKQLKKLQALQDELHALQGECPLVSVCVDAQAVAEVISGWTGVPLGKMVKDEIKTVLDLKPLLEGRVIGQSHALEEIAQRVRTARANLEDPNKPKGVFMFVGPSGVGKTETALALADILYGGERNLITINMSEYQEAHSVAGLKGSPPGYVGYGEGGVLTEAVRRKPYSVILLDEVEKAHPDVLELFFQVFDKGVMDDAEGRSIDFKNTVIILTSNVGSQAIMQACLNKTSGEFPSLETIEQAIRPQLYKVFKPAFLGRLKVIPYLPLPDEILAEIIRLKLERIKNRVIENHKADFSYTDEVIDAVLTRCTEVDSGARNVDHILNGTLLPEIAETVLARMAEGKAIKRVKVAVNKDSQFSYKIN